MKQFWSLDINLKMKRASIPHHFHVIQVIGPTFSAHSAIFVILHLIMTFFVNKWNYDDVTTSFVGFRVFGTTLFSPIPIFTL